MTRLNPMIVPQDPQRMADLSPYLAQVTPQVAQQPLSWLQRLQSIYDTFTPLLNVLLMPRGSAKISPRYPVGEQLTGISKYRQYMLALGQSLQKEKEDLRKLIRGAYISAGADADKLTPGSDGDRQITQLTDKLMTLYPVIFLTKPELISQINPRSSLYLAVKLTDLFARQSPLADPTALARYADRAALEILRDPEKHQGFTATELGDIAQAAIKKGLISLKDPERFTKELTDTLKLIAPLRDEAQITGTTFNPDEAASIAAAYAQRFPTMDNAQVGLEMRRELELKRRGGEYGTLAILPQSSEYIRRSGVPIEELAKQHEELKNRAAESVFGAGLGAVAKAVQTGAVSMDSPAGKIYQRASQGLPLDIIHPQQFATALIRSGVHPQAATLMIMTPEESRYALTPAMLNSLRLTQFQADWGPRFASIFRSIPGKDVSSKLAREALLSRYVTHGGYKNIHHFLALHGDALRAIPELRELALEAAAKQEDVAGYGNATWSGPARATAALQDIGEGARGGKYAVRDLLRDALQIHQTPDDIDLLTGVNPPIHQSNTLNKYLNSVQEGLDRLATPSRPDIPELEDFYDPSKYYGRAI